jgi:hypothetical protein
MGSPAFWVEVPPPSPDAVKARKAYLAREAREKQRLAQQRAAAARAAARARATRRTSARLLLQQQNNENIASSSGRVVVGVTAVAGQVANADAVGLTQTSSSSKPVARRSGRKAMRV